MNVHILEKPERSPSLAVDRLSKKSKSDVSSVQGMELDASGAKANPWSSINKQLFPDTPVIPTSTETPNTQDVPMPESHPKPSTFKDKLLGGPPQGTQSSAEGDDDIQILADDVQVSLEGDIPSITFSQRIHDFMADCMEYAVVVKLLGRFIRQDILYSRLMSLWKPSGGLKLTELDSGCFMVKFFVEADYQHAMLGGPWVVQGHYLTVHPWEPSFSPQNLEITQVFGWVRLPGLPYHYYHKSLLRTIGEVLGTVLKIDYNTIGVPKARFARLAVKIDLTKPLVSMIKLDGATQFVEYEGLPTICYGCGKYGTTTCSGVTTTQTRALRCWSRAGSQRRKAVWYMGEGSVTAMASKSVGQKGR